MNFTTRNSVEVSLNSLKQRGLVKTLGKRGSYTYYLSDLGIDRIRNFEDYDDRTILVQIAKLHEWADEHCVVRKN